MLHTNSEIDANFYRLIHGLVGSQLRDEPAERRGSVRHAFPVDQWIAPRRGPHFPEDGEFFSVRCHDLTGGGFSFFLPTPPDFTSVVAAFGRPPELIYVAAEVLRCNRVLLHSSGVVEHIEIQPGRAGHESPDRQDATLKYLVACRFIERLERPRGHAS